MFPLPPPPPILFLGGNFQGGPSPPCASAGIFTLVLLVVAFHLMLILDIVFEVRLLDFWLGGVMGWYDNFGWFMLCLLGPPVGPSAVVGTIVHLAVCRK